ncbi:cell envelope integrity protein TolA [Solilutibacter silvestris]|uniref:TolA protein n=1 Tax=Solilutibacter silvestris TaxID=1645665 RepID=A0A2K1Q2T1_9GAMM|nr:cell envelope integrity protein TolA [Lysobacter silvestris]PNS09355.1 TolA protein [Lysobacter silvestris]
MKEQRAAAARGTGYAILLHVVLIGLLLFGLHRASQQGGDAGGDGALQADVASVNDLSAKTRRALLGQPKQVEQPLPQPIETPTPKETPKPEPVQTPPQPVTKDVPPQKPQPERPQPSKPEPKSLPVDASKKVPMPEPAKKPAEPDLAALAAAQAARLAKATNLAKQRALQVADAGAPDGGHEQASARAGVGSGKSRNSGQQKWLDAVGRAIEAKWVRPDDIAPGQTCPIHIRIIPGGEVIAASVQPGCPYSEEAKRSVEKAVRDASPLPFKGYEDVYTRDFTANFKPSR